MLKNLYKYSLMLLSLGVLVSCSNDNDPENLFGQSATERINAQAEELSNLLQSSPEGWKMTYFTDDPRFTGSIQELGGWSFVFKFTDDKHVTMASDFSAETLTPNESEYEIELGSTTKVVFSTRNHIHLLSDSGNAPTDDLIGKGYKGDFEFLYYGQEGEELIFRSNRFQIELRFKKATTQDWTNLELAKQTGALLDDADMQLEINQGGEISNYDISYNAAARFVTNIEIGDLSFGVAPMANGLKVVKPIPVGDQTAMDFVYDAANSWFISELGNGDTAKIILDEPDPTAHLFESDVYYFAFQPFTGSPSMDSTGAFVTGWNEAYDNISNEKGFDLVAFFILSNPSILIIEYVVLDENGDPIYIDRNFTYVIDTVNDRVILTDNGGWTDSSYVPLLQPLEDVIFDTEGLKIIDTGNIFDGEPVYGFRSYNDSNSVFYTYTVLY